jgi:ketosteroid isomerase-like protein
MSSGITDNVERTREAYAAFARGDLDAIKADMDPDITWTVSGRSSLAGTYRGIDEVLGYFVKLFEISGGTFRADLLECGEIAPDLVACLCRISGDLPGGRLDAAIVQTFRERDGLTLEVRGYAEDGYAIDAAFGVPITLPDARTSDAASPIRA